MELESVSAALEEAEHRTGALGKQCAALEAQLADAQETMAEETRQKLAAQSRLRQAEDKVGFVMWWWILFLSFL